MENLRQYELNNGSNVADDSVIVRDRYPVIPGVGVDEVGDESDENDEDGNADDLSISSDVEIPLYSKEWCRRFVEFILSPDVPLDLNEQPLSGQKIDILRNTNWWENKGSATKVARGVLSASITRALYNGTGQWSEERTGGLTRRLRVLKYLADQYGYRNGPSEPNPPELSYGPAGDQPAPPEPEDEDDDQRDSYSGDEGDDDDIDMDSGDEGDDDNSGGRYSNPYVDDDIVTICAISIALNLSCVMSHNPSYISAMATRNNNLSLYERGEPLCYFIILMEIIVFKETMLVMLELLLL